MKPFKIGIIGSGNMAFSLGSELLHQGYQITEIYSRNKTEGRKLAKQLRTTYFNKIDKLPGDADLFFLCLQDDVITTIAGKLPFNDKIIIHTSGSVSMDALKNFSKQYGVFYPVQSINKNVVTHWKEIPICIEASSPNVLKLLHVLAKEISKSVYKINSEQRLHLHLAAVFANNFSNACFSMAKDILDESKLSFELIRPLILNTANKVQTSIPSSVQTGPAKRNDATVLKAHRKLLKDHNELKKVYDVLTKYIQEEEL